MFIRILRDPQPEPGAAGVIVQTPLPETPPAATPPAATPPAATPPAAGAFTIPDTYKDKPYLKGVDSIDKLFSMLDGAQQLIGKSKIPNEQSPQAEWDAFYEAQGRPKTADEYQFEDAEKSDPDFVKGMKGVLHKIGVSGEKAKLFWKESSGVLESVAQKLGLAQQQQDTDFEAIATKHFGVNRDAVLASGKELLDKFAKDDIKPLIAKLPNEHLILIASVLDGIKKTYIKPDGPPPPPSGGNGSAEARREEGRKLMATAAYTDPFHVEHESTHRKVRELYGTEKK